MIRACGSTLHLWPESESRYDALRQSDWSRWMGARSTSMLDLPSLTVPSHRCVSTSDDPIPRYLGKEEEVSQFTINIYEHKHLFRNS